MAPQHPSLITATTASEEALDPELRPSNEEGGIYTPNRGISLAGPLPGPKSFWKYSDVLQPVEF